MDFLIDILPHFFSVAGIIVSIYCFLTVRRPKFIVVNLINEEVVKNDKSLKIRYNNKPLNKNLCFQRFIICYIGASDTKREETDIPLTIYGRDKTATFDDAKIINDTPTFNPIISVKENSIEIDSPVIKNGDALEMSFYAISDNSIFYLVQRFFNVDQKIKYFKKDKDLYKNFIGWFVAFTIAISAIFLVKYFFDQRHLGKDEFKIKYEYQGYRVAEKYQWKSDLKVDSLFIDSHLRRNNISLPKTIKFDKNRSDAEQYNEIVNVVKNNQKYSDIIDSLNRQLPSKLSIFVYNRLKEKNKIIYDEELELTNDLKIIIENPRKDTFWSLTKELLPMGLFLLFSIIPIIHCTKLGIEIYYLKKVKKYIDY